MASRDNLTIYDATYLYLAIKHKLTLVTDDQALKYCLKELIRHKIFLDFS